jgi:phosphoribosyl-AMP cyclohydrolase
MRETQQLIIPNVIALPTVYYDLALTHATSRFAFPRIGRCFSPLFQKAATSMSVTAEELQFATRESKNHVEKGIALSPKFDADGLIPAIAIDHVTNEPLMLAYMNAESLRMTIAKGQAVYYSRSRKEIWHKGLTSGELQVVKEIRVDCDQDALVLKVEQLGGGCCHTKAPTCFYRKIDLENLREGLVPLVHD